MVLYMQIKKAPARTGYVQPKEIVRAGADATASKGRAPRSHGASSVGEKVRRAYRYTTDRRSIRMHWTYIRIQVQRLSGGSRTRTASD
jgi:hypothetical protein